MPDDFDDFLARIREFEREVKKLEEERKKAEEKVPTVKKTRSASRSVKVPSPTPKQNSFDPKIQNLAFYAADFCAGLYAQGLWERLAYRQYVIHFAHNRLHIGAGNPIYYRDFGITNLSQVSIREFAQKFLVQFENRFKEQLRIRCNGLQTKVNFDSHASGYGAGNLYDVVWDIIVSVRC